MHNNVRLNKSSVIIFFGGTQGATAEALGIKQSSVSEWPDVLSEAVSDRVLGACLRLGLTPPSDWLTVQPQSTHPTQV